MSPLVTRGDVVFMWPSSIHPFAAAFDAGARPPAAGMAFRRRGSGMIRGELHQLAQMTPPHTIGKNARPARQGKRKYNSPLRQQRMAETRAAIIAAGAELVHELPSWDWKNLSAKAVGKRAGVSERTVHRHFSSERALRDAVLQRLVEESGVDHRNLKLKDFDRVTVRVLDYLSSFAAKTDPPLDPSLTALAREKQEALLAAVAAEIPHWTEEQQRIVAAMLDMLWDPTTHDRLKGSWGLDSGQSIRAITWLIALVQAALDDNNRP